MRGKILFRAHEAVDRGATMVDWGVANLIFNTRVLDYSLDYSLYSLSPLLADSFAYLVSAIGKLFNWLHKRVCSDHGGKDLCCNAVTMGVKDYGLVI